MEDRAVPVLRPLRKALGAGTGSTPLRPPPARGRWPRRTRPPPPATPPAGGRATLDLRGWHGQAPGTAEEGNGGESVATTAGSAWLPPDPRSHHGGLVSFSKVRSNAGDGITGSQEVLRGCTGRPGGREPWVRYFGQNFPQKNGQILTIFGRSPDNPPPCAKNPLAHRWGGGCPEIEPHPPQHCAKRQRKILPKNVYRNTGRGGWG